MAQPDIVKPIGEVPPDKPDVDLRGFNAVIAADRVINGARILPDGHDITTYTRQALTGLPFSAKWPTFNELYGRNIHAKDAASDARIRGEEYTQDPIEAAVSSYAESLYFPSDQERIPEDLALRDEIDKSHRNFIYFSDFQAMAGRSERGVALIAVYDAEWQRIQGIHDEMKDITDGGEVAQRWVELRTVLDMEREFERQAMDASRSQRRISIGEDPRIVGSYMLQEQGNKYARILAHNEEARGRTIGEIKDLVTTISEVDPILTAEILWNVVLTDTQKGKINRERGKFRKAYGLATEASYFTDYRDPAYQAFRDHAYETADRGYFHGWPSQMAAIEKPTDSIEKTLIGDYSRIPPQTQSALQDRSTEGSWEIQDALKYKQSNPLQRYVTDVAFTLLYTDIAEAPRQ